MADLPVLALAPTERDANVTRTILGEAGIAHEVVRSLDTLVQAVEGSTGTLVLTERALEAEPFQRLVDVLQEQPSWSELPVVILSDRGADSPAVRKALEALGNVTLLDRPVRVDTLISVVRSSLRARQRQHQVRDQLHEVAALNQQLERLAFYDTLTGLPNRDLLRDRLTQEMARVRRHGGTCALLFLDFDDFKVLNDTMGHDVGDRALQIFAERLQEMLRDDDTVARLGGDEFVMLLSGLHAPADAAGVARKILRSVAEPFALNEHEVRLTTSIGIAPYSGSDETVEDMLKQADLAMYHAKTHGKRSFEFFTETLQRDIMEQLTLERDLRQALDQGQLTLHYQPLVRLDDGAIVGVEVLARWDHPARGLLAPGTFIPLAEELGLTGELGRQVLERACQQICEWQRSGHPALRVSVNLSARQLQRDDLLKTVECVLRDTGLPAHQLQLEITETATLTRIEDVFSKLRNLKALGLRLAIDDFGTGYSSLQYLQRLPIDAIKIDRGFVHEDDGSLAHQHNRAIVRAIVALGSNLGIELVGEGIETDGQRRFLTQLGCHEGQGFLLGPPMPPSDFEAQLLTGKDGETSPSPP